jgi:PHP family Zn ribbon phosphoesterase
MFKKYIECPKCQGRKTFETGPGAKIQCEWKCPKCHGEGKFTLGLWDRILLAVATKLTDVYRKYKIG